MKSILETSGIKNQYLKIQNNIQRKNYFLSSFDLENPSSVKNCITSARKNIRMVRTTVTLSVEYCKFFFSQN